jgi:hypothetical protein
VTTEAQDWATNLIWGVLAVCLCVALAAGAVLVVFFVAAEVVKQIRRIFE